MRLKRPVPKTIHESKAIGGHARARVLPPERRSEIARSAAEARWDNRPPPPDGTAGRPAPSGQPTILPHHPLTPSPSEAAVRLAEAIADLSLGRVRGFVHDGSLQEFRTSIPLKPLLLRFQRPCGELGIQIDDESLGTWAVMAMNGGAILESRYRWRLSVVYLSPPPRDLAMARTWAWFLAEVLSVASEIEVASYEIGVFASAHDPPSSSRP